MGPFSQTHLAGDLVDLCRTDNSDGGSDVVFVVLIAGAFGAVNILRFRDWAFQLRLENAFADFFERSDAMGLRVVLSFIAQSDELQHDDERRARIIPRLFFSVQGNCLRSRLRRRVVGGSNSHLSTKEPEMRRDYSLII